MTILILGIPSALTLLLMAGAVRGDSPDKHAKGARLAAQRKSMQEFQLEREAFAEQEYLSLLRDNNVPDETPTLVAALESSDANLRTAAAFVLGSRRDVSAAPVLRHMLADSDPQARVTAARALLRLGDPSGFEVVAQEAKSKDVTMRTSVVGLLPEFARWEDRKARVLAALEEALADPVKEVRVAAAAGVLFSDPPPVQSLRRALKREKDPTVRSILAEYLEWLDP